MRKAQRLRLALGTEAVEIPVEDVKVKPAPTVLVGIFGGLIVGMTSVGSGSLMIVALLLLYPTLRAGQLVGHRPRAGRPARRVRRARPHPVRRLPARPDLVAAHRRDPGVWLGAHVSSRAPGGVIRRALVVRADGVRAQAARREQPDAVPRPACRGDRRARSCGPRSTAGPGRTGPTRPRRSWSVPPSPAAGCAGKSATPSKATARSRRGPAPTPPESRSPATSRAGCPAQGLTLPGEVGTSQLVPASAGGWPRRPPRRAVRSGPVCVAKAGRLPSPTPAVPAGRQASRTPPRPARRRLRRWRRPATTWAAVALASQCYHVRRQPRSAPVPTAGCAWSAPICLGGGARERSVGVARSRDRCRPSSRWPVARVTAALWTCQRPVGMALVALSPRRGWCSGRSPDRGPELVGR